MRRAEQHKKAARDHPGHGLPVVKLEIRFELTTPSLRVKGVFRRRELAEFSSVNEVGGEISGGMLFAEAFFHGNRMKYNLCGSFETLRCWESAGRRRSGAVLEKIPDNS